MKTAICTLLAVSGSCFAAAASFAPLTHGLTTHTARTLTDNGGEESCYTTDAESNGCKWLQDCADTCGGSDKQCVGNLESQAWEDARDSMFPMLMNHTMICAGIAAVAADTTGCPSASVVAGFSDVEMTALTAALTALEIPAEYSAEVDTADKAKAFVTSFCASVPEAFQDDMEEGMSVCMSATLVASGVASMGDACSGLSRCSTDKMMLNEECLTALASAFGVSTATISTIHGAMDDLHTACQAMATEDACHGFDGSEFTDILTDTEVTMEVTTAAPSSALPQKAGGAMTVAAAVAFAVMLVA